MTSLGTRLARLLRLHPARLLRAPRVEVAATRLDADGGATVDLQVRGMVCGVCAMRTRSALLATPGVEAASVDLDAGTARLHLEAGEHVDVDGLQQSLDRVVIALPVRRALERVVRAVRGSRARTMVEGRSR